MKKITLKDLLNAIDFISFEGDDLTRVSGVTGLDEKTQSSELVRWSNPKNIEKIEEFKTGTFILDIESKPLLNLKSECNYIFVEAPRYTFQKVLSLIYPSHHDWTISDSATVDESSIIDSQVSIGQNVVIGRNCRIFEEVVIGHNTVINDNTVIEKSVHIGSNCTIGGVGFGYEKNPKGDYELITHIGNVHIKENAHIGNNTCIDRAVMGSTIIGKNVKVDNLVHIAHGVTIEDNSLIIANAMIGGSVNVGKNVWVAPSSSIINKVNLGNDSLVGLGAVVVKNVEPNSVVVGNPAKPLKNKV